MINKQYFCPSCGSTLNNSHYICTNCIHQKGSSNAAPQLYDLALKDNVWQPEIILDSPSVIAHEYWRLRQLCAEQNIFGVIIELRDVFEVALKFEVLALCAWIEGQEEYKDSFIKECGYQITMPGWSFGTWVNFVDDIHHYFSNHNCTPSSIIWDVVKQIKKQYASHNVVNWRNETIGHGALGITEDCLLIEDIKEMILFCNTLFNKIKHSLTQQIVYAGTELYVGFDKALNHKYSDAIFLRIKDSDESFQISPYMLLSSVIPGKQTYAPLYFYNQQHSGLHYSNLLSYTTGWHLRKEIGKFSELAMLSLKECINFSSSALISGMTTKEEIDRLNRLYVDRLTCSFVVPRHIEKWLRQCLSSNNKGVFMLCMDRGTGKSTFAEKLNSQYESPLFLSNDVEVRTYHLSSQSISLTPAHFEAEIENQWRFSFNKQVWADMRSIASYGSKSDPSKALLEFLKQCHLYTEAKSGKKQIMLVIDGLDEIQNQEIWNYFPSYSSQIPEGVYILFLTRLQEEDLEAPVQLVRQIELLQCKEKYVVSRGSKENIEFLYSYISESIQVEITNEGADKLIKASDYRVLQLSVLIQMLNAGLPLEEISNQDMLIDTYLKTLFERYGVSHGQHLKEVLNVIGYFGRIEALTLQEIADLTWCNGKLCYELLGAICDIAPFLTVIRGNKIGSIIIPGGNRVRFVNPSIAESFNRYLQSQNGVTESLWDMAYSYIADTINNNHVAANMNESYSSTVFLILMSRDYDILNGDTQRSTDICLGDLLKYCNILMPYAEPIMQNRMIASITLAIKRHCVYNSNSDDKTIMFNAYRFLIGLYENAGRIEEAISFLMELEVYFREKNDYNPYGYCLLIDRIRLTLETLESSTLVREELLKLERIIQERFSTNQEQYALPLAEAYLIHGDILLSTVETEANGYGTKCEAFAFYSKAIRCLNYIRIEDAAFQVQLCLRLANACERVNYPSYAYSFLNKALAFLGKIYDDKTIKHCGIAIHIKNKKLGLEYWDDSNRISLISEIVEYITEVETADKQGLLIDRFLLAEAYYSAADLISRYNSATKQAVANEYESKKSEQEDDIFPAFSRFFAKRKQSKTGNNVIGNNGLTLNKLIELMKSYYLRAAEILEECKRTTGLSFEQNRLYYDLLINTNGSNNDSIKANYNEIVDFQHEEAMRLLYSTRSGFVAGNLNSARFNTYEARLKATIKIAKAIGDKESVKKMKSEIRKVRLSSFVHPRMLVVFLSYWMIWMLITTYGFSKFIDRNNVVDSLYTVNAPTGIRLLIAIIGLFFTYILTGFFLTATKSLFLKVREILSKQALVLSIHSLRYYSIYYIMDINNTVVAPIMFGIFVFNAPWEHFFLFIASLSLFMLANQSINGYILSHSIKKLSEKIITE